MDNQLPPANTPIVKKKSGKKFWLVSLLVIMLASLAAGGVYYWQTKQAQKLKAEGQTQIDKLTAQASELQTKVSDAEEAADAAANSPANIKALMKFTDDAYWLYLGEMAEEPTAARLDALIAKKYLTEDFIAVAKKTKNTDPVVCTQNPLEYQQYDFETPKIKADTATQTVTVNVPNGGKISFQIGLIKENNKWLIDAVECKKV